MTWQARKGAHAAAATAGGEAGAGESARRVSVDDGATLLVVEQVAARPSLRLPIVLVPGWLSLRSTWAEFSGRLVRSATVYHIEARDKASATLPPGAIRDESMGVTRQARDLADVIEALGLGPRRFHLIGSSTGSNVILDYLGIAARANPGPPLPAGAVLMIPNRRFPIPGWARPLLRLPHEAVTALKPVIRLYIRLVLSDRAGERAMMRDVFASLDFLEPRRTRLVARALIGYAFPSPSKLSGIAVPTLVATASLDRMHDDTIAAEIASRVGPCEQIDVGESGNVHSTRMADRAIEFLARHEGG